jgi:hypothetical protein
MAAELRLGSAGEYWAKVLLLACCYQEVRIGFVPSEDSAAPAVAQ